MISCYSVSYFDNRNSIPYTLDIPHYLCYNPHTLIGEHGVEGTRSGRETCKLKKT